MPAPLLPVKRPGMERAIIWLSLFGLLIIVALFALLLANDREDLAADATQLAQDRSLVLAEHASRLFDSADLALSTIIDERRNGARPPDPRLLHQRLAWLAQRLPYVEAFWLHDADGRLILSSLAHPPPDADASESEFFIAHRENPTLDAHIGEVAGEGTSRPTFRISNRIEDERGNFAGVVSLTVEVPYFRNFYERLPLPAGSSISLRRASDLACLVRQPDLPAGHVDSGTARLRTAIEGDEAKGRYRAVSPVDGVERILAYRKVAGFPLYVTVSVPLSSFHDRWLGLVALRLAEAGAAVLILGLLTTLALREAGRQRLFAETLESRVTERTSELERAIQEVHHRVRNNLQVVGALLTMQAARVADEEVRAALSESIGRVHTISLVHQTLYGTGGVTELPFGAYLRDLAAQTGDLYGAAEAHIEVVGDDPVLPLETAVPLAIIVHEALSNALKHAYPAGCHGPITVMVEQAPRGGLTLTIADQGRGFAPGHREGLGIRIMRSLAAQVGATLTVTSDPAGTRVAVAL